MIDQELRRRLSERETPTASTAARARALHHAMAAWHSREPVREVSASLSERWLPWAAVTAVLALLMAGTLLFRTGKSPLQQTREDDRILLSEMQKLFPDTLCGVIREGGETRMILRERPVPQTDQMLAITLVRAGTEVQVLAFSGSELEIPGLAGAGMVEVLSAGDGSIILAGHEFIWRSSEPSPLKDVHLDARSL